MRLSVKESKSVCLEGGFGGLMQLYFPPIVCNKTSGRDILEGSCQHERAEFDGLTIDFAAHIVYVDGQPVDMSPKVYDLLTYLVRNQGVGLTREQLISNVWGYDFYGDDRTLDTHIKLLRLALGKYRDHVVTIRGYGYRFDA